MSASSLATQRCPKCGNENKGTNFQCTFCGKRLRIETIERVYFWKRIEEEWTTPYKWYMKFYYLFVNSPRAFWDINRRRKDAPGLKIFFLICFIYAFSWMALFSRFNSTGYTPEANIYWIPFMGFLLGLTFGIIYHFIFFRVLIWMFTTGANYAVDYSEKLESRFGKKKDDKIEKYDEAHMSPFSIYKSGVVQQQQAYKNKMMYCAFIPFIVIYLIEILIIAILVPSNITLDPAGMKTLFKTNAFIWAIIYSIEALVLILWVPSLMAVAIRELSNSSTYRVVISSYIVGIIIGVFYYFLRPIFLFAF